MMELTIVNWVLGIVAGYALARALAYRRANRGHVLDAHQLTVRVRCERTEQKTDGTTVVSLLSPHDQPSTSVYLTISGHVGLGLGSEYEVQIRKVEP